MVRGRQPRLGFAGVLLVGLFGCGVDAEPADETGSESGDTDEAGSSSESTGGESEVGGDGDGDGDGDVGGDGDGDGDGDGEVDCVDQAGWSAPHSLGERDLHSGLLYQPWLGVDGQGRVAALTRYENAGLVRYDPATSEVSEPSGMWGDGIFGRRLVVLDKGDALLGFRSASDEGTVFVSRFIAGSTAFPSSQGFNPGWPQALAEAFDLARVGDDRALVVFEVREDEQLELEARWLDAEDGNLWTSQSVGQLSGVGLERVELGADAAGNVLALWQVDTGQGLELWWNRFVTAEGEWTDLELVDIGEPYLRQFAVGRSGDAVALFEDPEGPGRLVARYFDGNFEQWSTESVLFELPGGSWYPFMNVHEPVVFSDGRALVAWAHQDDAANASLQWRLYDSGSWSEANELAQVITAEVASVSLAVDACDRAWAAWAGSTGDASTVWAALFDSDGATFANGEIVGGDPRPVEGLQLASNPKGQMAVVWELSAALPEDPAMEAFVSVLGSP